MKAKALATLLLFLPFLFPIAMGLDIWAGGRMDEAGQIVSSQVRYGENEMAPEWMPKAWVRPFLREIRLESGESIFARDLQDVSNMVSSSVWVKSVDGVRRDFKGNMSLDITVRKPECVIRRDGKSDRYLDDDMVEMPVLTYHHPERLKAEVLPIVMVGSLVGQEKSDRVRWLTEVMTFLREWQSALEIHGRLSLESVDMHPYVSGAARECRLKLRVKDLKFKSLVVVEWGIHRDFNALEGKTSARKWEQLQSTLGQDRPFSSLDLRYQVPDLTY